MTNYYLEAKTTEEKPIAWVTSGAPVEFIYAMDIIPVYPENYAAMCAASHQSVELMEAAENAGFPMDICAYARTDFGADMTKGGPIQGLPDPAMLICSTNICKTVIKWYEVVARNYDVPLFVVDTPFLHDGLTEDLIKYTVAQFKDLERFLGDFLGRPFSHERLEEVMEFSSEAAEYWKKMLSLGTESYRRRLTASIHLYISPPSSLCAGQRCVWIIINCCTKRSRSGPKPGSGLFRRKNTGFYGTTCRSGSK